MRQSIRVSFGLALAAVAAQPLAAQTSKLYVSGVQNISVLQGGAVINSWLLGGNNTVYQLPIAVSGDIRTTGYIPNGLGAQYTLGGVYTGTQYSNTGGVNSYDGTTDGSYNYTTDYDGGGVYRSDRNWAGSSLLFASSQYDLGITWDGTTNSLWVLSYLTGMVTNYSMTGTVLGSFNSGLVNPTSLAYDAADQTLWMYNRGNDQRFYQFSTAGAVLYSNNYGLEDNLGAEFDTGGATVTPEPTSIVLVATGLLGVVGVVRRRRRA